jgi:hypothetical protein
VKIEVANCTSIFFFITKTLILHDVKNILHDLKNETKLNETKRNKTRYIFKNKIETKQKSYFKRSFLHRVYLTCPDLIYLETVIHMSYLLIGNFKVIQIIVGLKTVSKHYNHYLARNLKSFTFTVT